MSLDHAILGVISFRPSAGYDIKVEFEHGAAGIVSSISFGTIYPRLKQLEARSLIETYQENAGGRQKKLYELTAQGWLELSEWLVRPPEYPIPMRDDLLLKMLFWGGARPEDRDTLIEHLQIRRESSLELLDYITQWPQNEYSMVDEYGMLVLDFIRARLEAELTWIEATITQLEGPPGPAIQDPQGLIPRQHERRAAALDRRAAPDPDPGK
jgi:PadR family transcriptional regulator AphA